MVSNNGIGSPNEDLVKESSTELLPSPEPNRSIASRVQNFMSTAGTKKTRTVRASVAIESDGKFLQSF